MISKILLLLIFVTAFVVIDASAQASNTHHLTVRATPNIIFISGSGDYTVGQVVTLDAAPATWQDYTFVGWKIDGKWAIENPPSIRMDRSHSIEAVYDRQSRPVNMG